MFTHIYILSNKYNDCENRGFVGQFKIRYAGNLLTGPRHILFCNMYLPLALSGFIQQT